jgi:DNA-binding transcriptional LysR family regulator
MTPILDSNAPTLRQLELFLSLAVSDGIASGGAKIGMTPSTTSHVLRTLENTLGTDLIDRNAPQLELTHAGQQILPHVRDLFAAMHLIQATAGASTGLNSGILRIGSFGLSSSLYLLPPLLQRFRKFYPGIDVRVFEKADAEIEQNLIERRLEIGVVTLPKVNFDTLPLATDELIAILPEGHELTTSPVVEIRQLDRYPLILTHAGSQGLIAKMFARSDTTPKISHELTQMLSILTFVQKGEGISVVASLALPEAYPGVVYRPLLPKTARRVGLACLNENRLSPAAAAFWKQARSSVKHK